MLTTKEDVCEYMKRQSADQQFKILQQGIQYVPTRNLVGAVIFHQYTYDGTLDTFRRACHDIKTNDAVLKSREIEWMTIILNICMDNFHDLNLGHIDGIVFNFRGFGLIKFRNVGIEIIASDHESEQSTNLVQSPKASSYTLSIEYAALQETVHQLRTQKPLIGAPAICILGTMFLVGCWLIGGGAKNINFQGVNVRGWFLPG